jgi:hypothetical protein
MMRADQVLGPTMPSTARPLLLLEGPHSGVGVGSEDAVHGDVVAVGWQQVLQRLDGMLLVTLADEGPGADRAGGIAAPRSSRATVQKRERALGGYVGSAQFQIMIP